MRNRLNSDAAEPCCEFEKNRRFGFLVRIETCEDCPEKEWGLRKCETANKWFDDFEIEEGIPDWCPHRYKKEIPYERH